MNKGLTSHLQENHTEMGPWFKVSPERPETLGVDISLPGLSPAYYPLDCRRSYGLAEENTVKLQWLEPLAPYKFVRDMGSSS